jgi:TolB-like protein/Tfp pilus assembly protein PilF
MSASPDIFLSYNREDQAVARRFAEAFERHGLSVWWDVTLRSGEAYDEVTEDALNQAKAVVVLWSPRSVVSRWVRAEATQADRNKRLVPVMIEPCRRPIMFELTQTADLCHWQGDPRDAAWQAFLVDVRRYAQATTSTSTQNQPPSAASNTPAVSASAANELSIAVLPFVNLSSDPEQEYFSDGLTEELLNQLAQMRALRVIGRTSCFAFKGKNEDLRAIGQKLGVAHILEGSVRKAGKRLRITAQLIKCEGHHHLWSQTYDRDLDDVFAIQDDVSRAVADALKVTLGVGEQAHAPGGTRNVEAYDLYLRALSLDGSSHSTSRRIADLARRAVALDPRFANGWLLLAESLAWTLQYGEESDGRLQGERDQALDQAIAIAPDLWAGHAARAGQLAGRRQFFAAERAYVRAMELGPHETNQFAMLLAAAGRIDEAIHYIYKVRRTDPLLPTTVLQVLLVLAGRYAEADAEYARAKDMAAGPLQLADWFALAQTLATQDRASAKQHLASLIPNSPHALVFNDELLAVFDDSDAAIAWIRHKLADLSAEQRGVTILFAFLAAYFDAPAYALELLHRHYIELKNSNTPIVNAWHPLFASVRKLPAFKNLVRELGIYDYWRESGKWGDFARPLGEDDFEVYR